MIKLDYMKNKMPKFEDEMKKIKESMIVKCPICERGYLLQEEKEHINEIGCCWSCETLGLLSQKLADKPAFAEQGKFCSECGTELEVEQDEDWLPETGFFVFNYLYCPKCKERVSNNQPNPYYNMAGQRLPF
jgi:endogenous inhibitor of DNA gyrase (YacG/DUF329 family)